MARRNTQLEAEAAEFFVLANLMLNKIPSHKNYTRHKDYDIIATDPANNRLARIQVKSRYRLNAAGFPISNFNSDFVVLCRLNRSIKDGIENKDPDYYIFPTQLVKDNMDITSSWNKFHIRRIKNLNDYYMNWQLIDDFLQKRKNKLLK
jgi:hypothetical protein